MNVLHSENVSMTNLRESPKYAAFELFFESQSKDEGTTLRKHMPKTTNCSGKGMLTLDNLQQKLYLAQERRQKHIERNVTKARSRQLTSTQKFSNVGIKRKQDGKSKRNQSEPEVTDSPIFEKKEIIGSSTHINTALDERNEHQSSVAFEVPFGPPGSYRKKIPRRFCKQKRTSVSIEGIKEKQHMAEIRKKELEEARLKRIKDRQESARKLAKNVEILLQQRSLASGQHDGHVQLMNRKEVMKTAQQVAQQFKSLSGHITRDLTVDWKFKFHSSKTKTRSKDQDCNENTFEKPSQLTNKIPRGTSNGVAFNIDIYPDKCTNVQTPKNLTSPQKARKKDVLTAVDVEEKLIQAEERRIRRREEKVKRVIANREALQRLSSNIETFLNDQEKSNNSRKLSRQEVANLANEIANGFDRLTERYRNDLKRAENFPTMNLYCVP